MKRLIVAMIVLVSMTACHEKKSTEFVETRIVDDVKVTWLQDNDEPRLMPRELFADAPDSLMQALNLQDGVPASVSTFLVEKDGKKLLFDAGLPDGKTAERLESIGIHADDIDFVFITHAHGDHIGGLLMNGQARYSNAELFISELEHEAWLENELYQAVVAAYKPHCFAFGDELPCGVKPIAAVGHTPGHTAFLVGKVLVAGDFLHGAALQLEHPEYCANFDQDKELAVASRKMLLEQAQTNHWLIAGMHLPVPAFLQK